MASKKSGYASIKSGFTNFRNDLFESTARRILSSLFPNVHFANPPITQVDLAASIENFSELRITAMQGTTNDRRARDAARVELNSLLKTLADYVTLIGAGDAVILGTSGFEVAKTRQPKPPIDPPQNVKVSNAGHEMIEVSCDPVKNAKMYLFQYCLDPQAPAANWVSLTSTVTKVLITGLTPGATYWFRVAAAGVRGQITYSMITSLICS